jgi:hypothetical protein
VLREKQENDLKFKDIQEINSKKITNEMKRENEFD